MTDPSTVPEPVPEHDGTRGPDPRSPARAGWRVDAALGLCLVLAGASAFTSSWLTATWQLFGSRADRADYLIGAAAMLVAAVGLPLLGVLVVTGFRASRWLHLVSGSASVLLLAGADRLREDADGADSTGRAVDLVEAVGLPWVLPTAWPLLAVALVAVVRLTTRSRRSRRPRPGR